MTRCAIDALLASTSCAWPLRGRAHKVWTNVHELRVPRFARLVGGRATCLPCGLRELRLRQRIQVGHRRVADDIEFEKAEAEPGIAIIGRPRSVAGDGRCGYKCGTRCRGRWNCGCLLRSCAVLREGEVWRQTQATAGMRAADLAGVRATGGVWTGA